MGFLYYGDTERRDFLRQGELTLPIGVKALDVGRRICLVDTDEFALACGVRPKEGSTVVNHKEQTIWFSNRRAFKPLGNVYIHTVDLRPLREFLGESVELLTEVGEHVFALHKRVLSVKPISIVLRKGRDVARYYRITSF
jgi:hypothetical protein